MNASLVLSSLLNFCAALVLALTAFVTARRHFGTLSFGGFAVAACVWSGASCLWRLSESPETALFLCRLLLLGAIFIPVTLLHLSLVLTARRGLVMRSAAYGVALGLALLDFTPALVAGIGPAGGLDLWPQAGPLFVVFVAYFIGCSLLSFSLLLSAKAGLGTTRRGRRKVVAVLALGFLGGCTNFPLWYGWPIPPVGNGLVFVYLAVFGLAVTRYRLPHLRTDLVKSAAFLAISLSVGLAAVLATIVVGAFTTQVASPSELTARFFSGTLITAFALWAVPMLVRFTEKVLEEGMLEERSRLQRELKNVPRDFAEATEEAEIFTSALQRLAAVFRANDVAIYFRGDMEPAMRLRVSLQTRGAPSELVDTHPLVLALSSQLASISTVQLAFASDPAAAALRQLGFDLAAPMLAQGRLAGILLVGRPPATRDDSEAVLSLLEAVGVQLALTVTARRLERRANESDKLIALGTLAAGLAHELRNPLTSIATFVSLAESGVNPAADPAFLRVVHRDSHRITSIVENVSVFATNSDLAMGPVDLEQVLASTLEIVRGEALGSAIRTTVRCTVREPIRGNSGQLQQVFVNLVQNAAQAIAQAEGTIDIVAEPIVLANGKSGARVMVRDSGPGVAPEVLPRIFEPFVTTKAKGDRVGKRGLGLGLAIAKRIIEAHRGDIRVESAPGAGTRFFVYLPGHTEPSPRANSARSGEK